MNCTSEQSGSHSLVTVCDRPEQHLANLGGDQRHAEISHQAFVSDRQSGHSPFLPAVTAGGLADLDQEFQPTPYRTRPTRHDRAF